MEKGTALAIYFSLDASTYTGSPENHRLRIPMSTEFSGPYVAAIYDGEDLLGSYVSGTLRTFFISGIFK